MKFSPKTDFLRRLFMIKIGHFSIEDLSTSFLDVLILFHIFVDCTPSLEREAMRKKVLDLNEKMYSLEERGHFLKALLKAEKKLQLVRQLNIDQGQNAIILYGIKVDLCGSCPGPKTRGIGEWGISCLV
jgi:hypothetical protein